jgi:tetratricopeptide (TPR) repeat protein
LHKFPEAQQYFESVPIEQQTLPIISNLGFIYQLNNKFIESELTYKRAINLFPTEHQLHNNLGNLYRQIERFEYKINK